MAYKRKYKRRTTPKKAKGANDKKVTVWSDHSVLEKANRALALVNNVRRFINVEVKYHDTTGTTVAIPATGTIIGLSDMAQGDGIQNRDGDSVKLLNNVFRATLIEDTVSAYGTQIRLILFRGKQENGSGFSATDILESATVISPKNYSERFRTKILMDKTYSLNASESSTTYQPTKQVNWVNKLIGHVEYATASTSIESGGLYLLMLSNQTVNTPSINYHNRLTFTDN